MTSFRWSAGQLSSHQQHVGAGTHFSNAVPCTDYTLVGRLSSGGIPRQSQIHKFINRQVIKPFRILKQIHD